MLDSYAVGIISLIPIASADYHKGYIWDSNDHSAEFHNGNIPMAFVQSELSQNLNLETGTTIQDVYSVLEDAIDAWDTETDFPVERYDTTTFYYDNTVGTADLESGTLGVASTARHWAFGYDDHIIRVTIDFNHDDYDWDHNGDDEPTNTANIYNVMLHEMGHVNGLCDTYTTSATAGDCHGHIVTDSVMYSYTYGVTETITTNDENEVNGWY